MSRDGCGIPQRSGTWVSKHDIYHCLEKMTHERRSKYGQVPSYRRFIVLVQFPSRYGSCSVQLGSNPESKDIPFSASVLEAQYFSRLLASLPNFSIFTRAASFQSTSLKMVGFDGGLFTETVEDVITMRFTADLQDVSSVAYTRSK